MADELMVDYWTVTRAIASYLETHLEKGPERDAAFWGLCAELNMAVPQFDWANAISDHCTITT